MTKQLIGLYNPRAPYIEQLEQIITLYQKISGKKTTRAEIEEMAADDGKVLTETEIQRLLDMQEQFPEPAPLPKKPYSGQ